MKTITRRIPLLSTSVLFIVGLVIVSQANAAPATIEPIVQIPKLSPTADIYTKGLKKEPAAVKTLKDAEALLDEASLAKLKESVNFEKQIVLIFAWKGSGQDKLRFDVGESVPEQITFNHKRGLTRDLRPHFFVFALRNDVTWSVK